MASLLSSSRPAGSTAPFLHHPSLIRTRGVLLQCCRSSLVPSPEIRSRFDGTTRRNALLQLLLSAVSYPLLGVTGASAEMGSLVDAQEIFRVYEDGTNKFRISIPGDWLVGAGDSNGFKSVTAFYPKETSDSNVSVVITGLGPDFTRLESFGNADAFAENLVSGLDRSWQRPPGLAAKLINSKAANGLYYLEYTLQNPGERCRYILSAVGMATNGWYNRLYTVTGQFMEDESDKYRSQIEKSVSSFRLDR